MSDTFSKSNEMSAEYCCTIVKIGALNPIEGSDFLATTEINGRTIVVRKDQVNEGDVMFYASNESQIDAEFLRANSLFEDRTMNADQEHKGYFNKYGRVRMVRLRGVLSMGYIFSLEELERYDHIDITQSELEHFVGEDFDEVNGKLFIKAFVPPMACNGHGSRGAGEKPIKRVNRMIAGELRFHYDTAPLERNPEKLQPFDTVAISVKYHGTSLIISNIRVKVPIFGGWYARKFNRLPKWLRFMRKGYDTIYSSRKIIQNPFVDYDTEFKVKSEYDEWYSILNGCIPRNITIYGEIVGYKPSGKAIQKHFDYGCRQGESALMIYRVKYRDKYTSREFSVNEVVDFTLDLRDRLEATKGAEVASRLIALPVLFHGSLADFYPDIPKDGNWGANVLERLKTEKKFGMEQNEPLCKNKVPREGIVVRIDGDCIAEAFKLKCLKFLGKEAEMIDKGEIDPDDDMVSRYGDCGI